MDAEGQGVKLVLDIPDGLPSILADRLPDLQSRSLAGQVNVRPEQFSYLANSQPSVQHYGVDQPSFFT